MKTHTAGWCLGLSILGCSTMVWADRAPSMEPPSSELVSTSQLLSPPTNIRATPNGRILCVAKKSGSIKIYGETGVFDDNGQWYYTNYCGRMGVIHSSQFISPG